MLYLRSFADDTLPLATIASARRPFFELFSFRGRDPFEEAVAWELARSAAEKFGGAEALVDGDRLGVECDDWRASLA